MVSSLSFVRKSLVRKLSLVTSTQGLRLTAVGVLAFGLTACSSVRDELGLARKGPDEFAVTTKAPLQIPEDLTKLPEPKPGAPRPQDQDPSSRAREALLGQSSGAPSGQVSKGEMALIESTGANKANAGVREQMISEEREAASTGLTDSILFWRGPTTDETKLDSAAEAERLRQKVSQQQSAPADQPAPAAAKPANPDKPTIEKDGQDGLLGSIF